MDTGSPDIYTCVLGSIGKGGPGPNDYRFGYVVLTSYGYSTTMQEAHLVIKLT